MDTPISAQALSKIPSSGSHNAANNIPVSPPIFCSGFGKYHTNERDEKKPGKKLKSYTEISWDQIKALVDYPQNVNKAQAQWVIPSTLLCRNFTTQEKEGNFRMLWADIDDSPPDTMEILGDKVKAITDDSDFECYTSRSATKDYLKSRVLIPLASPINGSDWGLSQQILNDKLREHGITPDIKNEGAAQLCYLPNRGEYYDTSRQRTGVYFDPLEQWRDELDAKRAAIILALEELERRKAEAKAKREALQANSIGESSLSLIQAFDACFTPDDILIQAGYDQSGDTFRHPRSESGSFSASIKADSMGVLRVHSLSSADPLYTGGSGGGAHDSFSCFTVLFHEGDKNAALKDAGDNWLTIDGESWNKLRQRQFMQNKAQAGALDGLLDIDKPFDLASFSLKGQSQEMRKKMLDDKFVIKDIAILGQATAFYAKPNTGKTVLTLYKLKESIQNGSIEGENVFYINADDSYKGLVTKTQLAEKYGFHMISPSHNGFESKQFLTYLRALMEQDTASGKIIVLDTLKKFADLMDKKKASDFMVIGREFISKGGTLILLAHTNKNRNGDGKVVFAGTSDIVDDVDCAYTLDEVECIGSTKKVIFENIKNRGDVAREIAFQYDICEGQSYEQLLDSVTECNKESLEKAMKAKAIADKLERNSGVIQAIIEAIDSGHILKTDLIGYAQQCSVFGRQKISTVLKEHTGSNYIDGDRWRETIGEKNAHIYQLIKPPIAARDNIDDLL
jgi:archaellum biogenesis ATPase FlaH